MQSEFKLAAYQYKLTTSTVRLSRPDSSTSGCATITQRTTRQSRHILKFRQFRPDGIRQRPKNFAQVGYQGFPPIIRVLCPQTQQRLRHMLMRSVMASKI